MSTIGLSFHPQCICEGRTCAYSLFLSCSYQRPVRLPIGAMAFLTSFTGSLSRVINPKWIIITGQLLVMISTLLLAFADRADRYWPFAFPGLAIGSTGAMLCYTHTKSVTFLPYSNMRLKLFNLALPFSKLHLRRWRALLAPCLMVLFSWVLPSA